MKAMAFDTLEFAKRLRAAEFTEKQAETLAAAVAEIIDSRLATKEDIGTQQRHLDEKVALLQRDIKELELRLDEKVALLQRDIKELELRLKHDLTIRLGGMLAAAVAIVAGLIKLL